MAEKQQEAQFALQRIYVKDLSFESPKSPELFKAQWKPEVKLDLNTANKKLEDDLYEVTLTLTVTVKNGEGAKQETSFLTEVKQAGVFLVKGLPKEDLERTLGAFCPNILFPYARETMDSLVTRGSFPPLMLAPVNFDALYQQAKDQKQQRKRP